MNRFQSVLTLALAAVIAFPAIADQVVLKNGDQLTGTIVKADTKALTMESEFAGKVNVQWDAITSISSQKPLNVGLKDGQTLVGTVETENNKLEIATKDAGTVQTAKADVTSIRSQTEQVAYEAEIERLQHPSLLDLWAGYLDLGLATARGNARTTSFNLGANAARTSPRDKISFNFTSLYSTNSTTGVQVTTANAVRGGVRYDVDIRDKWYGFGASDFEFDQFQRLDLRFVPAGGIGYHAFKRENSFLNVYGGGSMNKEFFSTGLHRTAGEVLFGDDLSYQLSRITSLQQQFVMFPNVSDLGAYRVNFDFAAVTKLGRWFSWQLAVSDRFLSNPVPGTRKNDILLTSGLRFTFKKE